MGSDRSCKKHENNYFFLSSKFQACKLITYDLLCNSVVRLESDLRFCMRVPYKRYMTTTFVVGDPWFLNSINLLSYPIFFLENYHLPQATKAQCNDRWLRLGDAYGTTLSGIRGRDGRKGRLGMVALMWISHSERLLKSDEPRHALAVEMESPSFNTDNIPSIGILLACCQGLVVVDKETSTIRLIHFTLQEHLRAHPELFSTAHSAMAEACLSYLNSQQIKTLSTRPRPDLQSTPFLDYSSVYWGTHAKRDLQIVRSCLR